MDTPSGSIPPATPRPSILRRCPCTGRVVGLRLEQLAALLLPGAGLLGLGWFLIRVLPRPSRAAYPCQRVAAPLAAAFLLWVAGLAGSTLVWLQGLRWSRHLGWPARLAGGVAALGVVVVSWGGLLGEDARAEGAPTGGEPHAPLGVGRGVFPGRVVWSHDPDATRWEGTNDAGEDIGDGYWWQPEHTDQGVVSRMFSDVLLSLAGAPSRAAAWDTLIRHFNEERGRGASAYTPGERFFIKINMANLNVRGGDQVDADGDQVLHPAWVNTSPQLIRAVFDSLVQDLGVPPAAITVGDTTAYFPNHYWDYLHPIYPEVRYLSGLDDWGRFQDVPAAGRPGAAIRWSDPGSQGSSPDFVPTSAYEASYVINLGCLKGHTSGVTLTAKNQFGSLVRFPDQSGYFNLHLSLPNPGWAPGMGHYRAIVDLIGHPHLGRKTLLFVVDGLYGGYYWEGRPYKWSSHPFGGDWPSSLLASQDPVAIDSVGYDLLRSEWPQIVGDPSLEGGAEDYLHEAALAMDPPSGTLYSPDGSGRPLPSLGVHEHWNNATDQQYSGDRGEGPGIELIKILGADPGPSPTPTPPPSPTEPGTGTPDDPTLVVDPAPEETATPEPGPPVGCHPPEGGRAGLPLWVVLLLVAARCAQRGGVYPHRWRGTAT